MVCCTPSRQMVHLLCAINNNAGGLHRIAYDTWAKSTKQSQLATGIAVAIHGALPAAPDSSTSVRFVREGRSALNLYIIEIFALNLWFCSALFDGNPATNTNSIMLSLKRFSLAFASCRATAMSRPPPHPRSKSFPPLGAHDQSAHTDGKCREA